MQLNTNRILTIRQVLNEVRDKRGAHADENWTKQTPQPLRRFYMLYVSMFVLEVAWLLLEEAIAAIHADDGEFRNEVFPSHSHVEEVFNGCRPPVTGLYSTKGEEYVDPGGLRFGFDYQKSGALGYTREPFKPQRGSIAKSTGVWFIRAPGPTKSTETIAIHRMLEHPGRPLFSSTEPRHRASTARPNPSRVPSK